MYMYILKATGFKNNPQYGIHSLLVVQGFHYIHGVLGDQEGPGVPCMADPARAIQKDIYIYIIQYIRVRVS